MPDEIKRRWESLRGSLWFVPSLLVLSLLALAFLMVGADRAIGSEAAVQLPLVFEAGPEGARELLSVIASSMIALAGVAFSFTLVVFSFASSQYSSRTLRSFMDDRTNQVVLGVLAGSFVYCLLVLRTVRIASNPFVEDPFVPSLSVAVALLLALLDLALFILYLHHIAVSIQAYHIIARIGDETVRTIDSLFPNGASEKIEPPAHRVGEKIEKLDRAEVRSTRSGYVEEIDFESLLKLAEEHDLLLEVMSRVGDFVAEDRLLVVAAPRERITGDIADQVRSSFKVGPRRTQAQDPLYGLLQLSDVAVKAMSPGINDPTTAMLSLDQIGRVLAKAVSCRLPAEVRCDKSGTPRLIGGALDFRLLVAQGFNEIRHYGAGDPTVAAKMIEVLAEVAGRTQDEARLGALREHALAVMEEADREISSTFDRARLAEKIKLLEREPRVERWQLPPLTRGER